MFEEQISFASACISLMGVAIIVYSALKSIYLFSLGLRGHSIHSDRIRLEFGSGIILSLEFMVAADIIESIAKPTYYDIGMLAALVCIRTFLSYSLNKELSGLSPEHQATIKDISK